MSEHPQPSARARELVRGAYDVHLHVLPDVMRRKTTDLELAQGMRELGLAGFVLKSHYAPTAERAAVVSAAVPGVHVVGSVTLNHGVGGLNPIAVEIAARAGGRVVWMPTFDSLNEPAGRVDPQPGAILPAWASLQLELRDKGVVSPPIEVMGLDGAPLPQTERVLERVAEHGMVLATGHLGRDEIFSVVAAAVRAGVERIVVTHPEFPSQSLSADDQRALAGMGALLERCYTTPATGKVGWDVMFANIRAAGPERSVVSSDLGQVENPPVEDGLALMADRLLEGGFTEDEVRTMTVTNSRLIAGAPAETTVRG